MGKIMTEKEFNKTFNDLSLNYDFSTPKKQKQTISENMENRLLKTVASETGKVINNEIGDFTSSKLKRRVEALNNQIDNLSKYLDIQENKNINKKSFFLFLNRLTLKTYDYSQKRVDIMLASAIWILDSIKENNTYDKLIALLEKVNVPAETIPWRDSVHDIELISKVLYVLKNRNKDICDDSNIWMDSATTKRLQHQDVPSRNIYEDLISLCGEEDIKEAVKEYETKYKEVLKSYASFSKRSLKKLDSELKATLTAWDTFRGIKEQKKLLPNISPNTSPMLININPINTATPILDFYKQLSKIYKSVELLAHSADYYNLLGNLEKEQAEKLIATTSNNIKIDEDYKPVSIENPYQLAFATLYLIDNDSDLPWCYFPGATLFSLIVQTLPWNDFLPDDQEVENSKQNHDVYKPIYTGTDEDAMFANSAQLIYNATNVIPPRKLEIKENVAGIHNVSDNELTFLTVMKGYASKYFEGTKLPDNDEEKTKKEALQLQNKNNDLVRINKDLQTAQNQLVSSQEKLIEEKERLEKEIESQNKELFELRKIVFEIESHTEIDEDKTIEYPYSFEKKIVIYGGHDKWLKHMNNLTAGNIEIVGPDVKIDKKLIQNADLLVIQINCISHPNYWRAIDAAKLGNTQILLLHQDSPRICVQQIIEKAGREKEK